MILKHAAHTAMFPIDQTFGKQDVLDVSKLLKGKDGNYGERIYLRGWTMRGRGSKSWGGVELSGFIVNYSQVDKDINLFRQRDLLKVVLLETHGQFGLQNEGSKLGDLGDGFYQYPVSAKELKAVSFSGLKWVMSSGGEKGEPKWPLFFIPLSKECVLFFRFKLKAYNGLDYFSPETNLQQTCDAVVKEFMQNVTIEYSAQSLADKKQAEATA
ncbi:hypothetical protein [Agaribacterium sp. ZY112]|uniref:hypothetical protein n=1 Tax=Agaribacterium sp. ZY112 TaxID=3233574 RepID=UPI003523E38F